MSLLVVFNQRLHLPNQRLYKNSHNFKIPTDLFVNVVVANTQIECVDMTEFRRRNNLPNILVLGFILTHVSTALHENLVNVSVEKAALLLNSPCHF